MKKNFHHYLGLVALVAGVLFVGGTMRPAEAAFKLRLFDSGTASTVNVTDGGAGDASGTPGVIVFIGTVGTFDINVQVGTSKPDTGSAARPTMSILSSVRDTVGGNTLVIALTDTDFTPPITPFQKAVNSALAAATTSITYAAFFDTSNAEFAFSGLGTAPIGASLSGSGIFSQSNTGAGPGSAPYSLTLLATVTPVGTTTTNFDASLTVPEPTSLLLLGFGFLALGFFGRRKQLG